MLKLYNIKMHKLLFLAELHRESHGEYDVCREFVGFLVQTRSIFAILKVIQLKWPLLALKKTLSRPKH